MAIGEQSKQKQQVLSYTEGPSDGITSITNFSYDHAKVSSITVDNASYNDVYIRRLREDFSLRKRLSIGGKIVHVRCCAHIFNLLVQDSLGQLGGVINVVREWIKYLNNSESRLLEFAKIKKQLQLPSRKLILDCLTRWNSTYLMLASGLEFKDVFPRYADIDPGFHYVPTDFEWMKVEEVCKFLEIFHEITDMIFGSEYPPANIFLVELYRIKELLNKKALDPFEHIRAMVGSMSTKFDKYWGKSNVLLSLGAILDQRCKMFLINHAFSVIYGEDTAPRFMAKIRDIPYELYNEYIDCHIVSHSEQQQRQVVKRRQNEGSSFSSKKQKMTGPAVLIGKEKFHMHVSEIDRAPPEKSDLDVYLEESMYACDANANLDVLGWWKGERLRFPILSRMAADILSVPVTTVASESIFSAGGRVIDDRRVSMSVETVQMLLCGNDWIRSFHGLKNKSRESLDAAESIIFEEVELPESFTT
ncbi:zinc finger BED domain-containing protein RICESLEEPER 2-like [Coffea arabica]|uniref:Zinc finger BED domain-containing protein RICESLEEPER 2-like n=1 Tax=Coffea arabica TaxID=13443 RepID=A0A6P6UL93_COFAR|nr:zinc finger BED domain-containing protein RICESLEEPER 2-like [Coffea arabica]